MSSPESDLFAAVGRHDRLAVAAALDTGSPIDARGSMGRTACFLAASWCRTESLSLLIERGADLELSDECGSSVCQGQTDVPDRAQPAGPAQPADPGQHPSTIRLSVGGAPRLIGGEQVVQDGRRVRVLYEQDLSQTVGGQQLSAPVKAHIRCYLLAGGSPIES